VELVSGLFQVFDKQDFADRTRGIGKKRVSRRDTLFFVTDQHLPTRVPIRRMEPNVLTWLVNAPSLISEGKGWIPPNSTGFWCKQASGANRGVTSRTALGLKDNHA
jgi:hypothetical protein